MSIQPFPIAIFPLPHLELKQPSPLGGAALKAHDVAVEDVTAFDFDERGVGAVSDWLSFHEIRLVSHALSPPQ